jgi:MOSC domain-containing protein YiiM
MATLEKILVAANPASEMSPLLAARAVAGRGIEGDRYFDGCGTFSPAPMKPDHEVTLIEQEQIDAFARRSGLPFTAFHARRNLVTAGIDLNGLVGREFTVGEVRLRGVRLCEPCQHLARISFAEALEGLVHRGGLRAQIVAGGTLRVGAVIRAVEDSNP